MTRPAQLLSVWVWLLVCGGFLSALPPEPGVERLLVNAGTPAEPFPVNCYVVFDEVNGQALVIDPGGEASRIGQFLTEHNLGLSAILLTHGHHDHVGAVRDILAQFPQAVLVAPAADLSLLKGAGLPPPGKTLRGGEKLRWAGIRVETIATPGHTPGSLCYRIGDRLFSGDTLFAGSIGRTDSAGSERLLLKGVRTKLLTLPEETRVFPGHGRATTLIEEKLLNPFLNGG